MRDSWKKYAERGSIMVEALAMLGLITMVTPVLYKKAAERTTELQDINTASQMRTISNALDAYIADHYQDLSDEALGTITIANDEILPYLPYGFDIENSKLFDSYVFTAQNELINQGETNEHSAITGTVLAKARDNVPMLRAAKIASMVGANGGVVQGDQIQGVQGGWGGSLSDFFGDESEVKNGSLAVSSVHAVTSSGGSGGGSDVSSEHVLYRDDSEGIEYNTMQTTLYMGGQNLEEVSKIIADDDPIMLDGNGKSVEVKDGLSVTGNLGVEGEGTISGATTVGSLVSNGAANIIGAITGGATAELADKLTVKDGGAEITGTTKITGDTTIKGEGGAEIAVAGTNIDVIPGGDGYVKFGDRHDDTKTVEIDPAKSHFLTANSGLAVKGGAAEADDALSSDYAAYIDGSILVRNNARVKGNMRLDGQLTASEIYGDTAIGGGLINPGEYNFKANADEVVVRGNNFSVGDRIVSNDNKATIKWSESLDNGGKKTSSVAVSAQGAGLSYSAPDSENGNYVVVKNGSVDIQSDNSAFVNAAGELSLRSGKGGNAVDFIMKDASAKLDIKGDNRLIISSSSTVLHGGGSGADESNEPYMALESGDFKVGADNLYVDADDIVFDTNAAAPNEKDKGKSVRESGIRINRQGIIDVAHNDSLTSSDNSVGRTDTPGYIRADRFLANKALAEVVDQHDGNIYPHYDANGSSLTSKYYDAYQVNPAYTSVMHDIKLTTRGGARLSDILPDFINKGIYVLDNTYKEIKNKEDWSEYYVQEGNSGTAPKVYYAKGDTQTIDGYGTNSANGGYCADESRECVASPWLGFVPTPQCPPGYSKVITISPIRWKMSQAYVVGENSIKDGNDYIIDSGIQNVGLNIYTLTNPEVAGFALEEATTSGQTEKHTHAVASGTPLTFQTNTWLNTTVSGVRGSTTNKTTGAIRQSDFLGWHAIMGFLYYGKDYKNWLQKVSGDNYDGKVVWNLFPVYNQEMAAIANVYCYFERRHMQNPTWEWNTELVDGGDEGYNQLTNFRSGFYKNNTEYNKRLNDPALGYDEVW